MSDSHHDVYGALPVDPLHTFWCARPTPLVILRTELPPACAVYGAPTVHPLGIAPHMGGTLPPGGSEEERKPQGAREERAVRQKTITCASSSSPDPATLDLPTSSPPAQCKGWTGTGSEGEAKPAGATRQQEGGALKDSGETPAVPSGELANVTTEPSEMQALPCMTVSHPWMPAGADEGDVGSHGTQERAEECQGPHGAPAS